MTGKIRLKLPKDSYVHTKEGNEGHFIDCTENRNENYIEVTREGLDVLLNDIFKSNWYRNSKDVKDSFAGNDGAKVTADYSTKVEIGNPPTPWK